MKNISMVLCLFIACATCVAQQSDVGNNTPMMLEVPATAYSGENVTLTGSGAEPGEDITLSISSPITVAASESMYHLGIMKMQLQKGDILSIKAEPVNDMLIGYGHWNIEIQDPREVQNYPAYFKFSAGNKLVSWTMPSWSDAAQQENHSDMGEWLKVVVGGKTDVPSVNMVLIVKRIVKADADGKFSTSVYVPHTKLIGKAYSINAVGLSRTTNASFSVDASRIINEPPIAFIYAPDNKPVEAVAATGHYAKWERAPTAKLGQNVTLDGRYSLDNDGSIVSYQWDFGDGKKADGPLVQHVYQGAGKYNVSLTVIDDKGATDTMQIPMAAS